MLFVLLPLQLHDVELCPESGFYRLLIASFLEATIVFFQTWILHFLVSVTEFSSVWSPFGFSLPNCVYYNHKSCESLLVLAV